MRQVYQAASVIDAQLVCDLLKDAGFNALVHGGYLSGAIGELPPDTLVSVYLLSAPALPDGWKHRPSSRSDDQTSGAEDAISDAEFEHARELIAEYESRGKPGPGEARDRTCSTCGEDNDAGFGVCWNCQASLDDLP